ncbi:tetratricopeptide repeat protein [Thiomicrorhabdus indica]|uniref:tetratricopeptide repeat protein n=1 Tax=Thiomicrorhabdus indica TaxID=2267253 RepID=UPI002AA8355A|nr:tetratricopeptide repeat protein [Thiomicrorhabdus indica]
MRRLRMVWSIILTMSFGQIAYAAEKTSMQMTPELQNAIDAYAAKDYSKARQLFIPLAGQKNVLAQFGLAKIYRYGQGIDIDYVKALKYYQQAAKGSYGVAQSHLGEMYEQGLGVDPNMSLAKSWYQIACANACSEGCLNLKRLQEAGH